MAQLDSKALRAGVGDVWHVHAFRRDELHEFDIVLQAAIASTYVLKLTDQQQDARQTWFGH